MLTNEVTTLCHEPHNGCKRATQTDTLTRKLHKRVTTMKGDQPQIVGLPVPLGPLPKRRVLTEHPFMGRLPCRVCHYSKLGKITYRGDEIPKLRRSGCDPDARAGVSFLLAIPGLPQALTHASSTKP